MLRSSSSITGYAIVTSDGHLGTVSDFLFDDRNWLVRWLIVETGSWLSGRKVLLPAFALGHLDQDRREFAVRLTMQQVKDSPNINTERPVSRQIETGIYDYYGWSPYWNSGLLMGGYGFGYGGGALMPISTLGSSRGEEDIIVSDQSGDDPHLRSTQAVTGYHIHAKDGEIGHVDDFLFEEADWSIHYLVVDTKNWWPDKAVLVSPQSVSNIDWMDNLVNLNVDRQNVKDAPAYDASVTVDRSYEHKFHKYYNGLGGNVLP